MTIALVAGARPNFIKAAPLWRALQAIKGIELRLIHTGQHRDAAMSAVFFDDLGLPEPDFLLAGNKTSIVGETARIALALESVFVDLQPDWVLVIGDVTSTLAAALTAKQMGIRVAHVEAGLRSGDRRMPEECNRIVVDHLSDLLFASEEAGVQNLAAEGIPPERVHYCGNVLIDALHAVLPEARTIRPEAVIQQAFIGAIRGNIPATYALFTLHRPENVDSLESLERMYALMQTASNRIPVVFTVHPRTLQHLKKYRMERQFLASGNIFPLSPLRYPEMIALVCRARLVVTDSGGVQEETTALGIPCLTLRTSTERPATVDPGTNTIIADQSTDTLDRFIEVILAGAYKKGAVPPLWDGQAAGRIAAVLAENP